MAKTGKSRKKKRDEALEAKTASAPAGYDDAGPGAPSKMNRKVHEEEMARLQGELVAMQEWVRATGARVLIVFEGRDTAGKGGTIKRITERVSPRVFRVVALTAPTERERSQMYIQRYRKRPSASSIRSRASRRPWWNPGSSCSSTGSRSRPTSRPGV
jgi:polyphosphate kinase 2 (PPK2 family)